MRRVRRTQGSRSSQHKLAIEFLEDRGLLSASVSTVAAPLEILASNKVTVQVGPSAGDKQVGVVLPKTTVESADSDSDRSSETTVGKTSTTDTGGRSGKSSSGKHSTPSANQERGLEQNGQLTLRIMSEAGSSVALADEFPLGNSEGTGVGDAGSDVAGTSLIFGWSVGSSAPPNSGSGGALATDDHTGSVQVEPGVAGTVAAQASAAQRGVAEKPDAADNVPGERIDASGQTPLAGNPEPATTWGDILPGAIRADWQSVDNELRQFLSRLRRFAGDPTDQDLRASRALWVGVCMAGTVVAFRKVLRRRWLFRRWQSSRGWAVADPPVAVGPWPLDSP